MAQRYKIDRSNPVVRYAIIGLMVVVLWIQVTEIRDQQALVICMFAVAGLAIMLNRLTYPNDRGPKSLLAACAIYGSSFAVLFINEIWPFLQRGPFQSLILLAAIISGGYGSYLSQKRTLDQSA